MLVAGESDASVVERVCNFKKRESVEVCIASEDSSKAMFPHQDCRVRVVDDISLEVRQFIEDLRGNVRVTIGLNQRAARWRSEDGINETPGTSH